MLKDYLGLPSEVQYLGKVYPVKILEFNRFRTLAEKYILLSNQYKETMCEITIQESQFESLMISLMQFEIAYEQEDLSVYGKEAQSFYENLLDMEISNQMSFTEFIELLEIVTRSKVALDKENMLFKTECGELNNDNFDIFREEVLRQNMLFEPLYYEDPFTQELLEDWRRLESASVSEQEVDVESIVQYVAIKKKLKFDEIVNVTYYQLMADYMRIQIDEGYQFMKGVISSGNSSGKVKLPNPAKRVSLDVHPEEQGFLKQGNDNERLDKYLGVN